MASLADIFAEVKLDLTKQEENKLRRKIGQIDTRREGQKVAGRFGVGFNGAFGGIAAKSAAAFAAGFAVIKTAQIFGDFITEARESAKVGRLTEQVVKSTGGAARITAAQVGDLATAISNKTGADDEAIQSGENLLLTFTNIKNGVGKGNKIFDQASQAVTDMAAAMNNGEVTQNGVKTASIQLGKALNDPIKGITALQKVGVSFTDDQKKQIKSFVDSGKTMEAQKVILGELGKEFGGAAAAASDPTKRLGTIIGNVKETIGTAFLPVVDKAATWLGDHLPGAVDTAGKFFNRNLLPPMKTVAGFVTDKVIPAVGDIVDTFTGLGTKIVDAIGPINIKGIGDKIWTDTTTWAGKLISGWKDGLQKGDWSSLGKTLGEGLTAAVQSIGQGTGKLLGAFGKLIDSVDWGQLGGKLSNALLGIIGAVDWGKVGGAVGDALITAFQKAKDLSVKIGTAIKTFMDAVDWEKVGHDSTNAIGRFIAGIDWVQLGKTLGLALLGSLKINVQVKDAILNSATDLAIGIFWSISNAMESGRQLLVKKTQELGGWLWAGLKSGIVAGARGIGSWLQRTFVQPVIDWAKSGFGVRSPSTVFAAIGRELLAGFRVGVAGAAAGIGRWIYNTVIVPTLRPFLNAGTWLVQQGRNLVTGLKNGVAGIASSIGSWMYNHVAVPAVHVFGQAGSWLSRAGRDLIGGLTGGIATRMKGIGSWIKANVVDPIVSHVKSFFGIASPSRVFAGIGSHLTDGLIKGMSGTDMNKVVGKIFGGMPAALSAIVNKGLVSVAGLPGRAITALGGAVGIGDPLGGPVGNSSNVGVVRTLAARYGWGGGAQWDALYKLIQGESGFRNTAQNPTSSAYGLFQFLDSTWGSVGASKTSDPWAQTIAGLRYIAGSYGSPLNAYSKWLSRSPHWYKQGTPWVPDDQLAYLHRGEAVIPRKVNEARISDAQYRRSAPARHGGDIIHIHLEGALIGSKPQMENWLTGAIDNLQRKRRIR